MHQSRVYPHAENLHDAWDNAIVRGLEDSLDSGRPEPTAHKLEQSYGGEKALDTWNPGHTGNIAWKSHQTARAEIYAPLHIPVRTLRIARPMRHQNRRSH